MYQPSVTARLLSSEFDASQPAACNELNVSWAPLPVRLLSCSILGWDVNYHDWYFFVFSSVLTRRRIQSDSVSTWAGLTAGKSRVPLHHRSDRVWGTLSLLTVSVRCFLPGVKRSQREADHSPPYRAELEICGAIFILRCLSPWHGVQLHLHSLVLVTHRAT